MEAEKRSVFSSERLILRPFEASDFGEWAAYTMDRNTGLLTGLLLPDLKAAEDYFPRMLEPGNYAIVLRETGRVIGDVSAHGLPPSIRELPELTGMRVKAISFALHPAYRHRGLMTEAVRALLTQLFMECDAVNCGCFAENAASAALQKSLGFHYLATHPYTKDGITHTVIENILLREEDPGIRIQDSEISDAAAAPQ